MNTAPLWKSAGPFPEYPALDRDLDVDVLVIGGGITGVSCAHLIGRSGKTTALVEARRLGDGDTSHTTAHLTYMTDTRISDLVRSCGKEEAKLAWQAGKAAMEQIKAVAQSCGAAGSPREVPGYLAVAHDADLEKEVKSLRDEFELIRELGFDVTWEDEIPPTGRPGIRFEGQMLFHPLLYLHAVAADASARGTSIFENTNVDEFHTSPDHVIANGHRIRFQRVIIATHVPLQGNNNTLSAALFQTKLASYSTYAISAFRPAGTLPEMIWSDTADPFNYLRIDRTEEGDRIVFGGEDHKTGQVADTGACYARLEGRLRQFLGEEGVTHRWSGQVVETVDGLPYIGPIDDKQFIATGFSGNGMTFGVAASMMADDWSKGVPNPCAPAFSPSRVHVAATGTYVKENATFPYRMLHDRFGLPRDTSDPPAGQGRVIRSEGEILAVCRDEDGAVHRLSAVCPHMGCIVAWNTAERTWDCPCHGSRFTSDGTLISGPAETNLKLVDIDKS